MSPDGVARRSCLSVPGGDERKLAKVAGCGADEVVLDLEDAVAIAVKDAARAAVAAFLAAPPEGVPSLAVRVNAARSRWCHQDVQAVAAAGGPPRSIVLPKVESAADVGWEVAEARAVLDALDTAGRSGLGAVALDGRMLDEALAVAARRTLARAGEPAHP